MPTPCGLGVMVYTLPPQITCFGKDGTLITRLYGHSGGTFGTASSSFINADGSAAYVRSFNTVPVDNVKVPSPEGLPWLSSVATTNLIG